MAAGDFRLDYAGLGEFLKSPDMEAAMLKRAEVVKAAAIAIAPDQPPYGAGYIAAFEVVGGVDDERAYAIVKNTSPHALAVEFGRGNTPRHRTLGKALGVE